MSKLADEAVGFRKTAIAKNDYTKDDQYNAGNADALSTGDAQGKGLVDGEAGNAIDVKVRKTLIAKNTYQSGREYYAGTV
jgi:hypothetical protein